MATYTFLRQLADSWFLIVMALFFLVMVAVALRPGSRRTHEDISRIPFRNEDAPKGE